MRRLIVSLSLAIAGVASAAGVAGAQSPASVDPGMTRAQVVERLGRPSGERSAGAYTYLFYQNGCERACGTPDLVVLHADAVVDAVFRSTARRYGGVSSSPASAAPARSAAVPVVGTDGVTEPRPTTPRRRGGLVTGDGPPMVQDPPQTRALRVAPSRRAAPTADGAAGDLPDRVDPRDSLSPRVDERATHEPHSADRSQARESTVPAQRDSVLAPAARPAPNVQAAPFTGARMNPTDSARMARQRALQRAGQPVRSDTSRRDTTSVRPPTR